MSKKVNLNDGYIPLNKGHQPAKPSSGTTATNGYQPTQGVGGSPANKPPPAKK